MHPAGEMRLKTKSPPTPATSEGRRERTRLLLGAREADGCAGQALRWAPATGSAAFPAARQVPAVADAPLGRQYRSSGRRTWQRHLSHAVYLRVTICGSSLAECAGKVNLSHLYDKGKFRSSEQGARCSGSPASTGPGRWRSVSPRSHLSGVRAPRDTVLDSTWRGSSSCRRDLQMFAKERKK